MCVPKEQDERTMPTPPHTWAHLTPGNRGPVRWVPTVLGRGGEVDTLAENPCPGHPQIP